MIILIILIAILVFSTLIFMNQKNFGKHPSGDRLLRIEQAENYKDGQFQNQSHTPNFAKGITMWDAVKKSLLKKRIDPRPKIALPSQKTDLIKLKSDEDILVWFGHSSYFMQIDGTKILVDPVLSGSASPLPNSIKAFEGSDVYSFEDIPEIDLLFITHDHWDHLDYKTMVALKPKIKRIICGLGVGEHLEHWGFDKSIILETNWYDSTELPDEIIVYTTPARHFSGRGFKRNKTLWASYVLETKNKKIYIGGDSGYDKHFAEIGTKHGPFDLAILENGQYDELWAYIHILPNEILKAAKELNAISILPVHSAKFALSNHPWYEPLEQITINNESEKLNIITPMIGQKVNLNDTNQIFEKWWRKLM